MTRKGDRVDACLDQLNKNVRYNKRRVLFKSRGRAAFVVIRLSEVLSSDEAITSDLLILAVFFPAAKNPRFRVKLAGAAVA